MRHPVILFDGSCALCNRMVATVIARDRAERFRFAPLQGAVAECLLRTAGATPPAPGTALDTLVVVDGDQVLVRSDAALRIARGLPFPWPLLGVCRLVPRRVRDAIYRRFAARRYRWFGRQESCPIVAPGRQARAEPEADMTGGDRAANAAQLSTFRKG